MRGLEFRALLATVVCIGAVAPAAAGAGTFTVSTSDDSGPGSLRQAITQSNGGVPIGSRNVIVFALPDPVQPITLLTELPPITEPVLIDGLTQPGARANADPDGFDAVLPIRLVGTSGTGLRTGDGFNNGTVTIRGLQVQGFTTGIQGGTARLGLEVLGSHISGAPGQRAGRVGIVLRRSSNFDVVGGRPIADTTLVTDTGTGVRLDEGPQGVTGFPRVVGSVLQSNDVGVELATFGGIEESLIGTLDPAQAGAQDIGVLVTARSGISFSTIAGNRIGVDVRDVAGLTGNVVSDNLSHGVAVSAGPGGVSIGPGAFTDGDNLIVDNGGAGVAILSGTGTVVNGNSIDGNGGLGIDLRGDGPTPNDPLDADDRDALGALFPNRLQNAPTITDATTAAGTTTVSGRFQGRPGTQVAIELFRSPSCDPSGTGEGAEQVARVVVNTDAAGNASVSGAIPSLPDRTVLTATATTVDGTSEFSPCVRSRPAPSPELPPTAVPSRPVVAADTTPPRITALSLVPSAFAVGPNPTPAKYSKVARGSTIRFTLSEAAQVELGFDRLVAGRRAGGKCQRPTHANRLRKRCTRAVPAGALNRPGAAGANRVSFSGRIGTRPLVSGEYRLTARAVDAAGNAATPRTAQFKVARERRRG